MEDSELLEDLKCGICLELLVDPTSLSCGHTVCRYCLAQWWVKSRKRICPQCRQQWSGFPKVNVTLRNTIVSLYKSQSKEKLDSLKSDPTYDDIMNKFELLGNVENRNSRNNNSRFSWTGFCILFAMAVGLVVIVSLGFKNMGGLSKESLKSKALEHWTVHDVGFWVGTLGDWASVYQDNFVNAGINGDLLGLFSNHAELEDPKINMTVKIHQTKFLNELKTLKETLPASSFDIWSYKERKNEMAMFVMLGVREFPRATVVYLYLFNYWDTFLPFFSACVKHEEDYTTKQLIDLDENPTVNQWLEFIPWLIIAPYGLIAKFAYNFLEQHYWTSRVVIMHAFFMTLTEFAKYPGIVSSRDARRVHIKALKYFGFVLISSFFFKIFWSFIPMFIADCIFYWMLYVSPFDAANRLIKRMFRARRVEDHAASEQVVDDTGTEVHQHHHQQQQHHHQQQQHHHQQQQQQQQRQQQAGGSRGWHFNFHWSSHDH